MTNIVLGGAIALILGTLLVLGLRIFFPFPPVPANPDFSICATGDAACIEREQQNYRDADAAYQAKRNADGRNIFIAANSAGFVLLLIGIACLYFMLGVNLAVGIMLAGAFGILYGYLEGWSGTEDVIKFSVAAALALLTIGGGIWINRSRRNVNADAVRR